MRFLELLAPARNLECGKAAIDHGADAVYIGGSHHGARVAAGNSLDDIRQLCEYAHQFQAKVYVTVNTIVYDNELEDTYRLIDDLAAVHVDAVLVQDMAVAQYILDHPQLGLGLHASTQTDNRSFEKVQWLASQGFSRVVLARELSADEIASIHQQVPHVELECFVHGALCVSYSGLCYASQYCFGRSANRGECAQFCRMKFDLLDASGHVIEHQRYLLSLKDLNLSEHLETLAQAGATSFKIEGRLKELSYVKNVTAAYSQLLDQLVHRHPEKYRRSSAGRCTYSFRPDLNKSFNRSYTTYFLHGRQQEISSFDTPKAIGEYVGRVKETTANRLTVAGVASFSNGDGLCFLNAKRELEGFRVNRVEGNHLFLPKLPASLRPGMSLFRNNSQDFDRLLSRPSAERKIPVDMEITATADGFRLRMDQAVADIQIEHAFAKTSQRENIIRQLTKLGGTPYQCANFRMADGFDYFIPGSMLSELRHRVVESRLQQDRSCKPQKTCLALPNQSAPPPYYPTYQYNIANRVSREFYSQHGLESVQPAFELKAPAEGKLLMQCRHCIKYALGFCVKRNGRRLPYREPLCLRLGDGRLFRLEFNCQHCQMNVYAEES